MVSFGLLKPNPSFHPPHSIPPVSFLICWLPCAAPGVELQQCQHPIAASTEWEFGGKLRSANAHVGLTVVGVTWVKHNTSLQFVGLQKGAHLFFLF